MTLFFMDYQPPTTCIVSITEAEEVGMFVIDIQSIWRPSPTYTVSQESIDYAVERIVMCPPGWPNPPTDTE